LNIRATSPTVSSRSGLSINMVPPVRVGNVPCEASLNGIDCCRGLEPDPEKMVVSHSARPDETALVAGSSKLTGDLDSFRPDVRMPARPRTPRSMPCLLTYLYPRVVPTRSGDPGDARTAALLGATVHEIVGDRAEVLLPSDD
jgi:hypothetical protein